VTLSFGTLNTRFMLKQQHYTQKKVENVKKKSIKVIFKAMALYKKTFYLVLFER